MASDLFNQNTGSAQTIATYSPNWADVLGDFSIPTGNISQYRSGVSGDNLARWTGTLPSGNHEAIVTVTASWVTNRWYGGPAIGLSAVAANGYALGCDSVNYFVGKWVAGAETDLTSGSLSVVAGDRLKISKTVVGGTATIKIWKALAASPTSFTQVGSDIVDSSSAFTAGTYGIYGLDNVVASGFGGGPWDGNDLSAVAQLGSRIRKNTIHPGRHPDRFGKRLRTRRYNTAPTLSTITGTAAVASGSDFNSASGAPIISGTAAARTQSDAAAANGTAAMPAPSRTARRTVHPGIKGPYNPIRLRKTINTAPPAATPITGTGAVQSKGDSASAAGAPILSGTGAARSAGDSAAASGTPKITATAAVTASPDASAASGSPVVSGTAAVKDRGDIAIASQNAAPVTGTGAVISSSDSATSSGSPIISGTAAPASKSDAIAATGSLLLTGFGLVFSAGDRASASGTLSVTGTGATISQRDFAAAVGMLSITGTGAVRSQGDAIGIATANSGSASVPDFFFNDMEDD